MMKIKILENSVLKCIILLMSQVNNKYEIDMCSGPLLGKLISFSIPLVLSSNLQLLFNAVDVIVVGKFSGSTALAAVGSTTALINIIINLLLGISLGASVLTGHFFALKDHKSMADTVHTSMTFALVGGLVVGIIGILLGGEALQLMGTPDDIYKQAALYIRVYFIGIPFFMIYNYGAAILRGVGDTKRPLLFLVIAGIINAVLNMILVIIFNMGVLGVAIATVFSQFLSCLLVLRCLCKTNGSYKLHFSQLRINPIYLKKLVKIGLPAGLQAMVINFSNILLQSSVNSFGGIAMAGYTAANNIFGFLYATINSFATTCMNFMSQNYAAKKTKRMDKVLWECIFLSVTVTIILGGTVYIFGEQILGIYTNSSEVIKYGMEVFLYTTATYFICGLMDLFPGAMRGMGVSTVPMILSVIGTVGIRIFWIYCIFPFHRSLDVLFISYPLSWIVTVIMQIICFIFVRRKCFRDIKNFSNN